MKISTQVECLRIMTESAKEWLRKKKRLKEPFRSQKMSGFHIMLPPWSYGGNRNFISGVAKNTGVVQESAVEVLFFLNDQR